MEGFLGTDAELPFTMLQGYVQRTVNLALAVTLLGLCVTGALRYSVNVWQQLRFIGLALLSMAFISGTIDRMEEPVTVRTIIGFLGITVSAVGTWGMVLRDGERA